MKESAPFFFFWEISLLVFFFLRILLLTESKIAKLLTRDCDGEHVYSFLRITIESHTHLFPPIEVPPSKKTLPEYLVC